MNREPDRLSTLLTTLVALRQGGGESTIQERIAVSPLTKVWMQTLHSLAIIAGFILLVGGVFLFMDASAWFMGLKMTMGGFLLIWVTIIMLIAGLLAMVRGLLKVEGGVLQIVVVLFLLLFLGVAVASALLSVREKWDIWRLLEMTVGAALLLGTAPLIYNQTKYLVSPYWPTSPFEESMAKLLFGVLSNNMGGPSITYNETQLPDYAINQGGQHVPPMPLSEELQEAIDEAEADEEITIHTIKPEDGNLIWFALFVSRLPDLRLRTLSTTPAPVLPFPEKDAIGRPKHKRLRKRMARTLLRRGLKYDWWTLEGSGAPARFNRSPRTIRKEALKMWREAMGDTPPPDYYERREYHTAYMEAA